MLIVHRLSPGAYRYYLAAVGPSGLEAPDVGEAPGRWTGSGAEQRGLAGIVTVAELRAVLPTAPGRLPGFDLTFAAPKSVSVVHGLGPPEVSEHTRRAHDAGVAAGLAYLERHGCAVRVGGRPVDGEGLVVATFRHRTSRADDPHLHTHALVANTGLGPDGQWRALHTPLLYAERRGAAATYHAVLRHELTRRLGVTWGLPVAGRADMLEVPAEVRSMFSRRRVAVLAGASDALAERKWAERVTRPDRHGLIDAPALRADWRARAASLGWEVPLLGRPAVPTLVPDPERASPGPAVPAQVPDPERASPGPAVPSADRWTRSDLVVAVVDTWREGGRADRLEQACDDLLTDQRVVALGRGSGAHAARRYTTVEATARRERVLAAMTGRTVDEHPVALDRLRREVGAAGGRLVIAAADAPGAAALADRTGAIGVPIDSAAAAVDRLGLGPADVVVLRRAGQLPSAEVEQVVAAAGSRGVPVVATAPPRAVEVPVERGPAATFDLPDGDLTVTATATRATGTAIDDWLSVRSEGRAAVIVAEASEVDDVNRAARAALRSAGLLGAEEVEGFAAGDVVRFSARRPTVDIDRHETALVKAVDPAQQRVQLSLLHDGRTLDLPGGRLTGLRHAHAVPPLPALIAGRGEVFMVGGRAVAPRHLGEHPLHRYLTVPVPEGPDGPSPIGRRTPLSVIGPAADHLRHQVVGPAAGDRRRLYDRGRAAAEWLAEAEVRRRDAAVRGDGPAGAAWRAQEHAARRAAAAVARESAALDRGDVTNGPKRDRLAHLDAHAALRSAGLVRAAELGVSSPQKAIAGRAPDDLVERHVWRQAAAFRLAAAERGPSTTHVVEHQRAAEGLGISR